MASFVATNALGSRLVGLPAPRKVATRSAKPAAICARAGSLLDGEARKSDLICGADGCVTRFEAAQNLRSWRAEKRRAVAAPSAAGPAAFESTHGDAFSALEAASRFSSASALASGEGSAADASRTLPLWLQAAFA